VSAVVKDYTIINILIPDKLLEQIEDYRFQKRFKNRAEAIRYLLEYAVKHSPEKEAGK
jgi:Arc/MetJ-type ribon-helix-helix transcriptional regulator